MRPPILDNFRLRFFVIASLVAATFATNAPNAAAQKAYDPGVTDTEIKIGNIAPYTGWGSEYAAIARAEAAYFQMINDRGGVNGRKINFISLDSASEPANMLPLARKLVEEEKVLLIFSTIGTESNLAIRDYLNQAKFLNFSSSPAPPYSTIPRIFPGPWDFSPPIAMRAWPTRNMCWTISPAEKIAVLYANDDAGKEYLAGVHDGLGQKAATMIVKEVSYQVSDASLDTQIAALKDSGADVFFNFAIGPFATKSIRAAYDLGWHPLQFIPNASLSIAAFLEPAGLEKSAGIICNARSKDWWSARSHDDPAVREFLDWMSKYNPQANLRDQDNVAGYERAQTLIAVLQKCGDNLTRENVMKQATNLDLEFGMLRPGIKVQDQPHRLPADPPAIFDSLRRPTMAGFRRLDRFLSRLQRDLQRPHPAFQFLRDFLRVLIRAKTYRRTNGDLAPALAAPESDSPAATPTSHRAASAPPEYSASAPANRCRSEMARSARPQSSCPPEKSGRYSLDRPNPRHVRKISRNPTAAAAETR